MNPRKQNQEHRDQSRLQIKLTQNGNFVARIGLVASVIGALCAIIAALPQIEGYLEKYKSKKYVTQNPKVSATDSLASLNTQIDNRDTSKLPLTKVFERKEAVASVSSEKPNSKHHKPATKVKITRHKVKSSSPEENASSIGSKIPIVLVRPLSAEEMSYQGEAPTRAVSRPLIHESISQENMVIPIPHDEGMLFFSTTRSQYNYSININGKVYKLKHGHGIILNLKVGYYNYDKYFDNQYVGTNTVLIKSQEGTYVRMP